MGQEAEIIKNSFVIDHSLLENSSMINLMHEKIMDLYREIDEKKNKIIIERIKEIIGIDLDIKDESSRRFKRFAIEYNENKETVYFNDGSVEGKRIVTFVKKDNPLRFDTDKAQIGIEYYYY